MYFSSTHSTEEPWVTADPDRFVDARDILEPGEFPPEVTVAELEASGAAHAAALNALEGATVQARMLVADLYAGIAQVLTDAAACPDPWVGADPTTDPAWQDPRGLPVAAVRAERRTIAVRAATLDLAVRLGMSELMIRARAAHADLLRERCPRVWAAFRSGQVSEQNATTAAQQAGTLPDDPETWGRFDDAVEAGAKTLPPGKFRLRARVARERAHPESIEVRHERAAADRDVTIQGEHDGMATLSFYGPAAAVHAAHARIDAQARHLRAQPEEDRTLGQLRADTFADLMANGETTASGPRAGHPSVAITVPVMTLLGHDDEPATLEGYGPIDTDTARRLAGDASSWVRILTHPITGTVLDVDRTTYRVPKALRRWLGVRDPVCITPGCTRLARDCDIDHRLDWQYGGATSADNTAPLCEPHHILKTKSNWRLYRDDATGATWWVTPTALTVPTDPPPW
ncbi:HNH endonuclease signature motif containing protein [Microbacterium cremeum]|uniref:HNH endonuclease signature motif containing protein n=1 Tax=Microbacterium cremeum TaxID=2782169 RepID=UPI001887A824|nr:HNH endonuclease signature motif containing protein [Microbacterium cremeum]